MFFNSIDYAIFLPIVYLVYWTIVRNSLKSQNILLLVASYTFYAWWDYRFLGLLVFSTLLDFFSGLRISKTTSKTSRRGWLITSVTINLGLLGVFKYFNFFIESSIDLVNSLGLKASLPTLSLILPVGISFYTFHGLSYVFDIYNDKRDPTKNIVDYSLFVSFFPLLVAGPIERAGHLLPQIQNRRTFNYNKMTDGLRQILWGLFKKIVIADNCAQYTNQVFDDPSHYNGSTLALAAILFAFQIYGDFSGYSDIALGSARLFGFELLQNFKYPYFSRDVAEFWRRWHISLSSWFRDYLYFPLGGSKNGIWLTIRNTIIIFLVSGFWHGANWTFLIWGALHACYFIPLIILKRNRSNIEIVAKGRTWPSRNDLAQIIYTFILVDLAWIFFRSASVSDAFIFLDGIFSRSFFKIPEAFPVATIILIALFLVIEWYGREENYAIEKIIFSFPRLIRWSFYYAVVILTYIYSSNDQQFIYFQF